MEQNALTAKQTEAAAARAAFAAIGSYPVRLTYIFTDPPTSILLTCKMLLNADDINARQAFYALPQGDMEAGQFDYEVDLLSRIVTRVDGLPGFEDPATGTLGEALKEYFRPGGEMLKKIATDAIQMYNKMTQPQEFFR